MPRPKSVLRSEQIECVLDLWAAGKHVREVSRAAGISEHKVFDVLQEFRNVGDLRAARRPPGPKAGQQQDAIVERDFTHAQLRSMDDAFKRALLREIKRGRETASVGVRVQSRLAPVSPRRMLIAAPMFSSGCTSAGALCAEIGE